MVRLNAMATPKQQLFWLSFLTLFLELALIRFLSGVVWNLGYFPNLVLIAVFLGMGIGFVIHPRFSTEQSRIIFYYSEALLALLILIVLAFRPAIPGFAMSSGEVGGQFYFTATSGQALYWQSLALFFLWFISIVVLFVLISQKTAKVFATFSPLTAYTLDIAGSCLGVLVFIGISFLQIPAWTWFCVAILCYAYLEREKSLVRNSMHLIMGAVVLLVFFNDTKWGSNFANSTLVRWSPYQRVELIDQTLIMVNGIGHQEMKDPLFPFYFAAFDERKRMGLPPYQSVLVLGAGGGNDVAAALQRGSQRVDAVEIDPVIADLGYRYHPLHPYSDPRVTVTVDDGRAFMTRATPGYDLIIFALTDSLVKVSPASQLRLENYLFTKEAVARAHALLAPGGDLLFYNSYRRPWIQEKIAGLLQSVTGTTPRTLYNDGDFAVIVSGLPGQGETSLNTSLPLPSDDWPFLYMQKRTIPMLFVIGMLGVVALVVAVLFLLELFARKGTAKAGLSHRFAFLSMGAAFLLLESKSVIQFSLLFGTTWLNYSLVFLAVLLLVLAANWTAMLFPRRNSVLLWSLAILLLVSCAVPLIFAPARLLVLEHAFWRFLAASALLLLPIFFANLLFSIAFREQRVAEHVFGWNLIGATLGGIIEYFSVVTGYSALSWVVLALYGITIVLLTYGWRGGLSRSTNAA